MCSIWSSVTDVLGVFLLILWGLLSCTLAKLFKFNKYPNVVFILSCFWFFLPKDTTWLPGCVSLCWECLRGSFSENKGVAGASPCFKHAPYLKLVFTVSFKIHIDEWKLEIQRKFEEKRFLPSDCKDPAA